MGQDSITMWIKTVYVHLCSIYFYENYGYALYAKRLITAYSIFWMMKKLYIWFHLTCSVILYIKIRIFLNLSTLINTYLIKREYFWMQSSPKNRRMKKECYISYFVEIILIMTACKIVRYIQTQNKYRIRYYICNSQLL